MALGVLVTGQGTYSYGPHTFRPGFTACDDQNVLAAVEREGLRWVEVVDQPADATKYPTPDQVELTTREHESAKEGPLTKSELKRAGYACRAPGCDKVLANAGGRATHEKTKHPDFVAPPEGGDAS